MRGIRIALALALAAPAARAHDAPSGAWHYDDQCCANQDCHPVACEQITATRDGFEYRDGKAVYFFTRDKMKPSGDSQCHACLHGSIVNAPMCLYLPVRSDASDARDR